MGSKNTPGPGIGSLCEFTLLRLLWIVSFKMKEIRSIVERRSHSRINIPVSTRVRGIDSDGQTFKSNSSLDNLSKDGLYLRLARRVRKGTNLTVIISLSSQGRLALRGEVLRVEPQPDGRYGIAMKFTQYRLL